MFKKEEYTGPVDQYGRPLNIDPNTKKSEDDRRLGKLLFTVLGIVFLVIVLVLFVWNYIQHTKLEIPKATLSTTDWTRESVKVTVDETRGNISEFSFDGGKTWQKSSTLIVHENKELTIKVRNSKGKESKPATVVVSNIDKDAPEVYFIDNFYVSVDSQFDPKANVTVLENGSGIETYEVDMSTLNLSVPGEYLITYYVGDKVGNEIQKQRKIVVESEPKTYYYRSRTIETVESDCEMECRCEMKQIETCPDGMIPSKENDKMCCNICIKPCQKIQYGEWSEWGQIKKIPSSSLEVEMKSE